MKNEDAVKQLYLLALCREPTSKELASFGKLLDEAGTEVASRKEAMEDLYWALLTSREFVFNR